MQSGYWFCTFVVKNLLTVLFLEENVLVEIRYQLLQTMTKHDVDVTSHTHTHTPGGCGKRAAAASNRHTHACTHARRSQCPQAPTLLPGCVCNDVGVFHDHSQLLLNHLSAVTVNIIPQDFNSLHAGVSRLCICPKSYLPEVIPVNRTTVRFYVI